MNYQELLTPENLSSVKGLELVAKTVLAGHSSGLNRSRRVGQGMEFSQYRSYEPGDDLRLLDWKMLARSSRYYIKQAEIDTNIAVKFIVDASASMLHEENGLSKMDYCRFFCATLGFLSKHQGDAVGLFSLNESELTTLYPKAQIQHFNRFLHRLVEIENKGKWPNDAIRSSQLHDLRHKELVIFISDMYEEEDELSQFVISLKTKRNEVILIQLMGVEELDFAYDKVVTFEDLETNKKIKLDASKAALEYKDNLTQHLTKVKELASQNGIEYLLVNTENGIGKVLNQFLKSRNSLR